MVAQDDMLQGAVQVLVEGRSLRAIRAGEHSLLQGITGDTDLGLPFWSKTLTAQMEVIHACA